MGDDRLERRAILSGIGKSAVGRRLGRSEIDLTLEACRGAVADAGLELREIDGIIGYPGETPAPPGFTGPSPWRVKDALRLDLTWHQACADGAGQLSAVMSGCLAVASGVARHVLVYRTTAESSGQGDGGRRSTHPIDAGGIIGLNQWLRPFGAVSAANWLALAYQRYLHEFGARRDQIGWIAVTERAHAERNPEAIFREPLTIDEYMASRMISSPFCLYDCDVPADGSVAVVVSTADHAADAPRPIRIEAIGSAISARPYWDQWRDPTDMAARDAARHLWSRTTLRPRDVDVAALYDGFTFLVLVWLEALGFCGRGEAASFVEGGRRIGLDGELPLNTGGGQLSAGRLHGYGHLHEACAQLRGACNARQVAGAEVALVGSGGGPFGGCLLLTK